jgi:hypothetical protein
MSIAKEIIYISIFFWLLPPFRQYGAKFFYYFLILAISDPVSILYVKVTGLNPDIIQVITGFFLFYTISNGSIRKKNNYLINVLITLTFLGCAVFINDLIIVILIIHLFILSKLIRITLVEVYQSLTLNIFLLAIVFYELSVSLNLSVCLSGSEFWLIIYYTTLSFQILLAIFFTVFNEKSNFLIVKLKPVE